MEAKELMIGDWVLIGNNHIRITSLQEGKDYVEAQPIPLTAGILEKNGFDIAILNNKEPEAYLRMGYLDDNGEMEDVAYDIIIDHHKTYWELTIINNDKGCRIDININYIHELQHALRLCGIYKEIVL